MKFTLKEMNGLLNGKCPPSDLIVGETLAEYLVRKFSALEQRLIESERYGRQTDITIDNLELKLAQMAAENAGLKAFGEKLSEMHNDLNGEGTGIQGRTEVACQQAALEAAIEEFDAIKTPATEAFLAEVRAQGVDVAIEHLINKFEGTGRIGVPVMALEWLAKELRKGVQS